MDNKIQNIKAVDVLNKLPCGLKGKIKVINRLIKTDFSKLYDLKLSLKQFSNKIIIQIIKYRKPKIPVSDKSSI